MKKKLSLKEYSLLLSLYISQYIGLSFFAGAFIAILRKNEMPLEHLGIIYMLGLFWVFRFLWAPFIDGIEFKGLAHYKGWIIIFQFFMALILFVISKFSILNDLQTIIILSVFFAFFSSSQTIALDGLVYKNVFKKERSRAMSIKIASGLIGMILGGGGGLILYSHFGWEMTMVILASVMFIALIQVLFYKESKTKKDQIIQKLDYKQFISFWKGSHKKQWLLLLFLYPVSISLAYSLITPILTDLGWSLDKIGYLVHMVGYSIGICASFATSWFIQKYGEKKVLVGASIGQVLGLFMLLLLFKDNSTIITIFIIGFIFTFYTPAGVTISTLMMNKSSKEKPATQFAIQHSIFSFAGILFGSLGVSFSGIFGYSNIIIAGATIGLFTVYVAYNIKLQEDKVII